MIARLLFALLAMLVLGLLLHFAEPDRSLGAAGTAEPLAGEPGYVALGTRLVQTGADGRPLYRLDATRIAQPTPLGTIYLTAPRLVYRPPDGNEWVLTALQGEMPQDASTAELRGAVQAEGRPIGSSETMRIDGDSLHLDMTRQTATTDDEVRVAWGEDRLQGRGLRADLKSGRLRLQRNVSGVLVR